MSETKENATWFPDQRSFAFHAFYNLSIWETQMGDLIVVDDTIYRVNSIDYVEENDASLVGIHDITIITCIHMFIWDKRMIIGADELFRFRFHVGEPGDLPHIFVSNL